MGRRRTILGLWRVAGGAALLAVLVAAYGWWRLAHWMPPRGDWPVQGIEVGAADVPARGQAVNFVAFGAIGADFAYLDASRGAQGRDPAFAANLAAARRAGLRVGVVHSFDPCIAAERQAANFVVIVPRDPALLPPAVELDRTADDCAGIVSDAAVESELTTFLNQIEGHAGKPALLKLSRRFEKRHRLASRIERDLWLAGDWFRPAYAGRPFALWTANSALRSEASTIPVRWVVVQP